jgi:tagatose 1,6-diphosphate aldolase
MTAPPFPYLDPGPLADGDLELIPPDERWLDAVMAAQDHPLTRELMPAASAIPRQKHIDFIRSLRPPATGFHPGDDAAGLVPAYHFWMRSRCNESASHGAAAAAASFSILGGLNLRLGHTPNLERVIGHIGYSVYPFARGRHCAERSCRLLLPLARRCGMRTLWITCNPDNLPSRRTCERLGARMIDIIPVPTEHPLYVRGEKEKCRYRLDL